MARILITATGSGCGKTTITCGILMALKQQGLPLQALKCGPDYIDPMFHREALGIEGGNLDLFFMGEDFLRQRLASREQAGLCLLEGAMGYYDGIGTEGQNSARDIGLVTETPAVLIVDCAGMGVPSVLATVKGFITYGPNTIRGVIFNRMSRGLFEEICGAMAEDAETAWPEPLGYFPKNSALTLQSRHLGLVTPEDKQQIAHTLEAMGAQAAQSLRLDRIVAIAGEAAPLQINMEDSPTKGNIAAQPVNMTDPVAEKPTPLRIGVAKDAAFCFYYEENLQLLEQLGAQPVPFSPLADKTLPECDGLYLGGGYPELYGEALSANTTMRQAVLEAWQAEMPIIAECGGFLYLHRELEDEAGNVYPMAGALEGRGYPTGKLQRFGYITLQDNPDREQTSPFAPMQAHEFHYWESTCPGEDFLAKKAGRNRSWTCGYGSAHRYAGFPHLYFHSNVAGLETWMEQVRRYHQARITRK